MAISSPSLTHNRAVPPRGSAAMVLIPLARRFGVGVLAVVVILVLWAVALKVFQVEPFVGKSPLDVFNYLFVGDSAGVNRQFVGVQLGQSLIDSAIGFAAGLAAALILAALFMLIRGVENALMPIAILLQSVPLIAMAPIIILIFGRSTSTLAVMGGLVVLFPALITIVFGLRSASPSMIDLVSVYGGGPLTVLTKVAIPSALPALFAAIKISVPGAITGALIAEWLATGKGIGGAIVSAVGQAEIGSVWAMGTVITVVSIGLYSVVGLLETLVLRRMGVTVTSLR